VTVSLPGGAGSTAPGGTPGGGTGVPGVSRTGTGNATTTGTLAQPTAPAPAGHPANIVFVLTDDLATNLLPYMPVVQALQRRGMTFADYFVSDSLCCPSRASIFTGNFPHDTHIETNVPAGGGFSTFWQRGEQQLSFNIALERAGYDTAMMGKYLNGYLQSGTDPAGYRYVPPGWNEWDAAGFGYPEFDYLMNQDGAVHYFGHAPGDYLTDVLTRRGVALIDRAAAAHRPFFLELATYAPHRPYTPAPQDKHDFPGLTAPETPAFNRLPTHPPRWLAGHHRLAARKIALVNRAFRRRAQSVQAVDRMIEAVESALAANHETQNTYIVFSSDNGLHMGEHRLMPGKLTAYDTDIHVPLIVAGPGVPAGTSTPLIAQNVDLAQTFAAMAGASAAPDDGHSLLAVMHGHPPPDWRSAALVEHRGPATSPLDPDAQSRASGNPTTYVAMRTSAYLYVQYLDGEHEFYDLRHDPYEIHNRARRLTGAQRAALNSDVDALHRCHTGPACWAAAHVAPLPGAIP
jgi:arylsulfatase A-like enzyme